MMIHEITEQAGKNRKRKRIGRGHGSGWGKQSGRGHKGAGSRRGHSRRYQFEGGQMPYFRRMPKFGFSNANFTIKFWAVNLREIVMHDDFAKGGSVNTASLVKAGLVRDDSRDIKVLGSVEDGGLKVKLDVEVSRVTDGARKHIEGAGGSVKETGTRRDRVRGIDRNSDDRSPKNLTKKLRRGKNAG
ncbi:MAG: 50S ribosomal protein L15 [Henriciella sp.]|nr:50S ribosomal protein L15 [Henriciella sp.]